MSDIEKVKYGHELPDQQLLIDSTKIVLDGLRTCWLEHRGRPKEDLFYHKLDNTLLILHDYMTGEDTTGDLV